MRIVTWNVRYKSRPEDIAVIIRLNPGDIWLLQEVSNFNALLTLLGPGWSGAFVLSQNGPARSHGTAIISRMALEEVTSVPLGAYSTPHGDQSRHYLQATINGIVVGCVHLSCTSPYSLLCGRNLQDVKRLLAVIEPQKTNFVLGGDFNAGRRSPGIRKLRKVLVIIRRRRLHTWRYGPIGRHLDHFFTTTDIQASAVNKRGRGPSDHHRLEIDI